jgi:CRISPR-associated Cas5-like protein
MNTSQSMIWLAADYHFPSLYSYRVPMSSMTHAPTLPTPGPAAIRLALLRRSIELFGKDVTREEIFPIVRAMQIRIRPPEAVAISLHRLRAAKWEEDKPKKQSRVQESLMLREMAHAEGQLTIYLHIPANEGHRLSVLLQMVGYWGQTDSFACCLAIYQAHPLEGEYMLLLQQFVSEGQLQPFFSGLATEFRDNQLSWEEVTAIPNANRRRGSRQALLLDLYIWPLVLLRQHDGGKLFQRRSLRETVMEYL